MNFGNLIRIALKAIRSNALRSLLTMLGIIIGVASVITMLAIGQGSKESIRNNISQMGTNMLTIRPGSGQWGGVRQSSSSMQTLKITDYNSIINDCEYISDASPLVQTGGQAIYASNNTPTTIYGVSPSYNDIKKMEVVDGIMFTEQDVRTYAKVCVVGKTIVENLFPDGESPIGKVIRFNKIPFTIIGVYKEKGDNSWGQDQDDLIVAPYTTVQKRIMAITHLNNIICSAISEELSPMAITELETLLKENHKIREGEENDFNIRSQQEMMEMMSSTTNMLTILLACVAGISLLVGGIGIMNIMIVSVTERTREIGLRMSIGAKGGDILLQFLIEAIIISVTGGLIGITLGFGVCTLIEKIVNWPVSIQTYTVILSFAVCTIVGIIFGWYPAKKAANLDPITALRHE